MSKFKKIITLSLLLLMFSFILPAFASDELISAVKEGDTQKVQEILTGQPNLLNFKSSDGYSLLHYSVMERK